MGLGGACTVGGAGAGRAGASMVIGCGFELAIRAPIRKVPIRMAPHPIVASDMKMSAGKRDAGFSTALPASVDHSEVFMTLASAPRDGPAILIAVAWPH